MEQYILSVAIKKGIYAAAKAIVAVVVSAKAVALEKKFGITINATDFQIAVGSALFAIEHDAHMWLKEKYPSVSWL
jgi:hypothetical protein